MAIPGVSLVAFAYGSYLAMLVVLRRFTYRTWLFHAVILAGIAMAVVGLAGAWAGERTASGHLLSLLAAVSRPTAYARHARAFLG